MQMMQIIITYIKQLSRPKMYEILQLLFQLLTQTEKSQLNITL